MTDYFIPGATCCCGQCIFNEFFSNEDIRWETTSDGTGTEFIIDETNEWLDGTGDGSYTMQLQGTPDSIIVEATLLDNGTQTESGITIGVSTDPSRITLVRVWAIAESWELRQGDTVLESLAPMGDPTHVKLVLTTTGTEPGIEVWFNDVLEHIETGTFIIPADVRVGVIALDGGRWDNVVITPCPGECPTSIDCGLETTTPLVWLFSVDAGDNDVTQENTCDMVAANPALDECHMFSRDWYLLDYVRARMATTYIDDTIPDGNQWCRMNNGLPPDNPCTWISVFPYQVGLSDWPDLPEDTFPTIHYKLMCNDESSYKYHYGVSDNCSDAQPMVSLSVVEEFIAGEFQNRLELTFLSQFMVMSGVAQSRAKYTGPWHDSLHDYKLAEETLTVDPTYFPANNTCAWPSTLIMRPLDLDIDSDEDRDLALRLTGCEDLLLKNTDCCDRFADNPFLDICEGERIWLDAVDYNSWAFDGTLSCGEPIQATVTCNRLMTGCTSFTTSITFPCADPDTFSTAITDCKCDEEPYTPPLSFIWEPDIELNVNACGCCGPEPHEFFQGCPQIVNSITVTQTGSCMCTLLPDTKLFWDGTYWEGPAPFEGNPDYILRFDPAATSSPHGWLINPSTGYTLPMGIGITCNEGDIRASFVGFYSFGDELSDLCDGPCGFGQTRVEVFVRGDF